MIRALATTKHPHADRRTLVLILVTCVCMSLSACTHGLVGYRYQAPGRVIAIGDIHGNYSGLVNILQRTRLIDTNLRWIGQDATLVQTGDFLDRGEHVRKVMDLLMSLQTQAKQDGGRVWVLLGNHEALNLVGSYRDVAKAAYRHFADAQSIKHQEAAYQRWQRARQTTTNIPFSETKWKTAHPPGMLEYQKALGPQGTYGRWLRTLPVVVQVQDSIFIHGGISPSDAQRSFESINHITTETIAELDRDRRFLIDLGLLLPSATLEDMETLLEQPPAEGNKRHKDKLQRMGQRLPAIVDEGYLFREDGPLWFRGYATWPEEHLQAFVPRLLSTHRAQRIVVAHSVTEKGLIRARLAGRIILIDTGMLSEYYHGGQASALEIHQKQVKAIYPDQTIPLFGETHNR